MMDSATDDPDEPQVGVIRSVYTIDGVADIFQESFKAAFKLANKDGIYGEDLSNKELGALQNIFNVDWADISDDEQPPEEDKEDTDIYDQWLSTAGYINPEKDFYNLIREETYSLEQFNEKFKEENPDTPLDKYPGPTVEGDDSNSNRFPTGACTHLEETLLKHMLFYNIVRKDESVDEKEIIEIPDVSNYGLKPLFIKHSQKLVMNDKVDKLYNNHASYQTDLLKDIDWIFNPECGIRKANKYKLKTETGKIVLDILLYDIQCSDLTVTHITWGEVKAKLLKHLGNQGRKLGTLLGLLLRKVMTLLRNHTLDEVYTHYRYNIAEKWRKNKPEKSMVMTLQQYNQKVKGKYNFKFFNLTDVESYISQLSIAEKDVLQNLYGEHFKDLNAELKKMKEFFHNHWNQGVFIGALRYYKMFRERRARAIPNEVMKLLRKRLSLKTAFKKFRKNRKFVQAEFDEWADGKTVIFDISCFNACIKVPDIASLPMDKLVELCSLAATKTSEELALSKNILLRGFA